MSPANFIQPVAAINFLPHHMTDKMYSGFVQDEIPLVSDRLSLTVGSKFEHNNYAGFEVQPSARLLWNRTPHQTFWASISRAVRTPSRLDENIQIDFIATATPLPIYLRVLGDGQFYSEELVAYEAGYRALVTPHSYLDFAVFQNEYNYLSSFQVGSFSLEPSPAPAHAILPLLTRNGIKGAATGFEVVPDWKPTNWWELKPSYSYLNVDLKRRPGSNDPSSVLQDEGSSPRNQVMVQSFFNLPGRFEFDQTYRGVSALPSQSSSNIRPVETVQGYGIADVRLGWHVTRQLEFSVTGQYLLQPHHAEFGGTPGALVGIKRSVYVKPTWRTSE